MEKATQRERLQSLQKRTLFTSTQIGYSNIVKFNSSIRRFHFLVRPPLELSSNTYIKNNLFFKKNKNLPSNLINFKFTKKLLKSNSILSKKYYSRTGQFILINAVLDGEITGTSIIF